MSPILFDLFINELAEVIRKSGLGVLVRKRKVGCLMFADDIVLIADSKGNLQKLMDLVWEFSCKWRFNFNYDKTAVLVFQHHRGKIDNAQTIWKLGNTIVQEVNVYKYLGMEMDRGLTFREFKNRIADKARRNEMMVWSLRMRRAELSVKANVNMWKALVRPNLEYGAELWGFGNWEEAEVIQRSVARKILHCNSKAVNAGVRGELGLWTMESRRDFIKLRYWIHLLLLADTRLVKEVYLMCKENFLKSKSKNWACGMYRLVRKYNLEHLWEDEGAVFDVAAGCNTVPRIRKFWRNFIFRRVQEVEQVKWRLEVIKSTKLRIYATIKQELRLEEYLLQDKVPKQGKIVFTALRIGSYPLRIETGRWQFPIEPREERVCLKCMSGAVEDEKHMMLDCKAYELQREELYRRIGEVGSNPFMMQRCSRDVRFRILLGNGGKDMSKDIWIRVMGFLSVVHKVRKNL